MKIIICFFLLLILGLVSPPAHAYLDPSTGSMIITAIVGLFASIALAVKTYWYKLKSFFRGSGKTPDSASKPGSGQSSGKDDSLSRQEAQSKQGPDDNG